MVRIPTERQGQTGVGQCGYGCFVMQREIGRPVTTALRSPLPLETDLAVLEGTDSWTLVAEQVPETVILEATPWVPDCPETAPVSIDAAEAARQDFPLAPEDHPAPHCLSCGTGPESLCVHAGPIGDGRWATPFRVPERRLIDGRVDPSLLWMAVDCACGWYTSQTGGPGGRGVTVQFAVEVLDEVEPETDYALVAWNGDFAPDWDGRKRGAAAALFAADGRCIARSRSFWLRPSPSA